MFFRMLKSVDKVDCESEDEPSECVEFRFAIESPEDDGCTEES